MIAFQYGVEGHTFLWRINCIVRRNCNEHSRHTLNREISTQVLIKIVVMLMVALTSNPIPLVLFATKCYQQISVSKSWKWKQTMNKDQKKVKHTQTRAMTKSFHNFHCESDWQQKQWYTCYLLTWFQWLMACGQFQYVEKTKVKRKFRAKNI